MNTIAVGVGAAIAGTAVSPDRDRFYGLGLIVLGAAAVVVLGHGLRFRRPVTTPPVDLAGWFRRWQDQHNAPDVDPSKTTALRVFLTFTYRLARPLAHRGVSPSSVTIAGLWLAALVPVTAMRLPLVAAGICVVSSVVDGVDGAVAGLTGRATRSGFVLDSVVDRLSEAGFFLALVVAGADARLGAAGWAGVVLLEYTRARAGNAGLGEIGIVTIAERPTRVLCVVFGLIGAAIQPDHASAVTSTAALVATITSVVGVGQLAVHLHRRFEDEPGR